MSISAQSRSAAGGRFHVWQYDALRRTGAQRSSRGGIRGNCLSCDSVGGRAMEALIESGMVAGVLDVTTTEWADQLAGGVMPAERNACWPARREVCRRLSLPVVWIWSTLDRARQFPVATLRHRRFYQHNPQVTLMRTTPEECAELGRVIAFQLNQSMGPVHVLFPLKAISVTLHRAAVSRSSSRSSSARGVARTSSQRHLFRDDRRRDQRCRFRAARRRDPFRLDAAGAPT